MVSEGMLAGFRVLFLFGEVDLPRHPPLGFPKPKRTVGDDEHASAPLAPPLTVFLARPDMKRKMKCSLTKAQAGRCRSHYSVAPKGEPQPALSFSLKPSPLGRIPIINRSDLPPFSFLPRDVCGP